MKILRLFISMLALLLVSSNASADQFSHYLTNDDVRFDVYHQYLKLEPQVAYNIENTTVQPNTTQEFRQEFDMRFSVLGLGFEKYFGYSSIIVSYEESIDVDSFDSSGSGSMAIDDPEYYRATVGYAYSLDPNWTYQIEAVYAKTESSYTFAGNSHQDDFTELSAKFTAKFDFHIDDHHAIGFDSGGLITQFDYESNISDGTSVELSSKNVGLFFQAYYAYHFTPDFSLKTEFYISDQKDVSSEDAKINSSKTIEFEDLENRNMYLNIGLSYTF